MEQTKKPVIFSGIQPSGVITIGNYLGSLKNWVPMQENYDCIFCVVDMHAITVPQNPAKLRKNTYELLALYLACGLDPNKSTLFVQSHVPAHAELSWVLNTISYVGEMNRMTQFKDKSKKQTNINMGLMSYPVLMAADILLYQTDLVPVGADQKQHLELSRDLAQRFNSTYSDTFVVPEPYIGKETSKILSLVDGVSKMSKSDENENAYVSMLDDKDTIIRKFKRAVTDSGNEIKFDPENKGGISNLISILSGFAGMSIQQVERAFARMSYGEFKQFVGNSTWEKLSPIQEKQKEYLSDKAYLDNVLKQGAEKAQYLANKTLSKVYKKVGFIPKVR